MATTQKVQADPVKDTVINTNVLQTESGEYYSEDDEQFYDPSQAIFGSSQKEKRIRNKAEEEKRKKERDAYLKKVDEEQKVATGKTAPEVLEFKDFNGDYSRGTAEGENYVTSEERMVYVLRDTPVAKKPLEEQTWNTAQFNDVLAINYIQMDVALPALPELEKLKIAVLKTKLVQLGLTSPLFVPGDFHVKHNDCRYAPATLANKIDTPYKSGTSKTIDQAFTKEVMVALLEMTTDFVCMSNHHFKARGHHWTETSEKQYQGIVNKLQLTPANIAAMPTIKGIFSDSMHCIFPVVKEAFALKSAQEGKCSGAMTKRINVCPAGGAVLPIIYQGYNDLKMIAPGLQEVMPKEIQYLEECMKLYNKDRMQFSVNAVYYGRKRQVIDEQALGALGAVVFGTLTSYNDQHPLLQSKALQRVANLSPITGFVVAKQIKKIGSSVKAIAWLTGEQSK